MAESKQSAAIPPQSARPSRPDRPNAPAAGQTDYVQVPPSFWQHPFVRNVLPFATSILLHAGIIILGVATFKAVEKLNEVVKEQIIIPDATIVEGAEVGGVPNPGLGADPNITADTQIDVQDVAPKADNQTLKVDLGGGEVSSGLIGRGIGGSTALNPGTGSGLGSGDTVASPFGVLGSGSGPKVGFMGATGNATRIVFLCDASGTMVVSFPMLRQELSRTLEKLQPIQFFNVIFFHGNTDGSSAAESIGVFPNSLVAATADNKSKAYDWIKSYGPAGSTDPFPAIEKAFAMKPELLFVLTDGFDNVSSYQAVRGAFKKANSGGQVKVNTILLQTTADPDLEDILKKIAEDNGGRYRTVKPD